MGTFGFLRFLVPWRNLRSLIMPIGSVQNSRQCIYPLHRLFFHAPRQVKTQNGLRLVDYVFVKGSMSASILDVSIITFMPVGLHIGMRWTSPFCTTLNPCFTLLESPRRMGTTLAIPMGQSEPPPMNAHVGHSVHRTGCIFAFSS